MSTSGATLVGTTGLVGSHIAALLTANPAAGIVTAFARRPRDQIALPASVQDDRLNLVVADSASWAAQLPSNPLFFSGLATTLAVSGSAHNQYAIDFTLNRDLAVAAKQAGCKVYVLISAAGANSGSWFHYPRMKGQLDDAVSALAFDHTIIVRPAMILGDRAPLGQPGRTAESALQWVARSLGSLLPFARDYICHDAADIAAAAVAAALKCQAGQRPAGGTWIVGPKEINRLATEYRKAA